MKRLPSLGILLLGIILIVPGKSRVFERGREPQSKPAQTSIPHKRVPVLVELFTSESCPSCPPADALLARLVATQPVDGAEIVGLEQHVDYWNRRGWTDPYSSEGFSLRQAQYSDAFELNTVYTPQVVVDGRAEFNGGDERRLRQTVAQAANWSKATVRIGRSGDPPEPDSLIVVVSAQGLDAGEAADVLLAVTEDKLSTNVPRGPNAGRQIDHSAVMRLGSTIGEVKPGASTFFSKATLKLDPAWHRENLRVVALIQEQKSRRVLGVAGLPLAKLLSLSLEASQ